MKPTAHMIVTLTPAFAEVLAHLHTQAFKQQGGWTAQTIASTLSTPGTFGLMTRQDNEPLGFVLIRNTTFQNGGGESEVLTLATLPAHRRVGVARTLINAGCARAHVAGANKVFLEVATDNAPARALYESLGFERAGQRKAYYARTSGTRVDAVVMVKILKD